MTVIVPLPNGQVVGALVCQKDSYLRSFEAEVVSCVKSPPVKAKKDKKTAPAQTESWLIEFSDSVLFPEGGGQPSDHGTVLPLSASAEAIPIRYVQRQGLQCIYHSPIPLEPGTKVRQEIDFSRRWDHMQQHTGQHLLSAIMDTYEGLETLGWGMGAEGSMNYVDLSRTPTAEEIQAIQKRCNEVIRSSLPITVSTPASAKTDSLPDDYDKEKGIVRIINIGDIDHNPCCGTHLANTSHISLVLLHHSQPVHGTDCRLFFSAGDRAIKLATDSINALRSISQATSSPANPKDVVAGVKKHLDAAAELKKQNKKLLADIAQYEGVRIKAALQAGKNAWVYRPSADIEFLNLVVFEVKDVLGEKGVVIMAGGEGRSGGPVVIIGAKETLPDVITKAKEAVAGIKGGGKGERWQGKVSEWKKGELEALKQLVES